MADSIRKVQDKLLAIENAKLDSIRTEGRGKKGWLEVRTSIILLSEVLLLLNMPKDYAESYRQQGYDPKIIKMEGSNFELVSAESHENLRKAISRLHQFQDTVEIDAWMYIRE